MANEDVQGMAIRISMEDSSFSQGMQDLKRQLSVVDSSFKSSIAGVKDWGTSLDGLEGNAVALGDKINIQKQIIQQYQEQLDKASTNLGKSSQAMMDLKSKVESAKTAWEESKTALGTNDEATLKLKKDYDDLTAKYKSSENAVRSNGKSIEGYTIQVNNASGKLKNLESDLTEVGTKFDEASKKESTFGQTADKLGLNMTNIKTAFGAVGIAVGAFLGSSVKSAGAMESSEASLEQTVKSTGDAVGLTAKQMEDLAEKEQGVSTFSKDTVVSGEAVLATFTNIGKNVFPQATQSMLDMAQKMGTDPTASAKMLGRALNEPVSGLSALTRAGVQFSAGQKEQIKTMVATGNTAGAQGIIIDQLNQKFGGQAAAAANTYEGSQKKMENELQSVKETIGTALIPVLTELMGGLAKILTPIADFIQKNPQFTAAILSIVAVVGTLVGGLSVISTMAGVFAPLAIGMGYAEASATTLMLPVLGVIAAIVALAAVAFVVVKNWGSISGFFKNLWSSIKTDTESAWNGIKIFFSTLWTGIKTTASTIFTGIGTFFITVWNGIKTTTENVWNGIKTFFVTVWNGIKTVIMAVVTPLINGIMNTFNTISPGLTTIFNGIKTYFIGVWNAIKLIFLGPILLICDLVTGNFTKLQSDAVKIFTGLQVAFTQIWAGIKGIFTGALQVIVAFLTQTWNGIVTVATSLWNGLKNFFVGLWSGITTTAIGAWNALKNAIINTVSSIVSGAINIFNGILNFFRSLPGTLQSLGAAAFNALKSGITSVLGTIGGAIQNGFNSAISFLTSLPSRAMQWGRDFIQGLISGITGMIGGIVSAVTNVATTISSILHFSVPDEGPLKDYEKWMPDMMAGMANGIQNSKSLVTNAIKGLSTDMSVGVKYSAINAVNSANQANATQSNVATSQGANNTNSTKQPVTLQLVLQNGKDIANYLIDDIDYLLDKKATIKIRRGQTV